MSPTIKAAIRLGENHNDYLIAYKNTNFDALKALFDITQKSVLDQDFEILYVSTFAWTFAPWMRSTLLHDKVIKWAKGKVHVYSDSVVCLGKMLVHSEADAKWKDLLEDFQQSNENNTRVLCGRDCCNKRRNAVKSDGTGWCRHPPPR